MTPEQIQKATIKKVDSIMSDIIKEFEKDKNLSHSELIEKWNKKKEGFNFQRFGVICEILTDNGVNNLFDKNTDNALKSSVVQIASPVFDDCVNEYYYTKIKPIITSAS